MGVSEENLKSHFIVFFFFSLLFRKQQTTAFVQTHAVLTTTKLWNKLPFTLFSQLSWGITRSVHAQYR